MNNIIVKNGGGITVLRKFNTSLFELSALIVVLCIIFLVPLNKGYDLMHGIQTGKIFLFLYFTAFALFIQTLKLIFNTAHKNKLAISLIDVLLIGYFILVECNIALRDFNCIFSLGNLEFIALAICYTLIRQLKNTTIFVLLYALLIIGIIQAGYGMLQLYGFYPSNHGMFKITGSFFNPGPYSGFLATIFVLAMGIHFYNKSNQTAPNKSGFAEKIICAIKDYLPPIAMVAIILVLPATRSRAAWLAVIAGFIFMVFKKGMPHPIVNRYLPTKKLKSVALIMGICLFIIALSGIYWFKKDSANGRLLIWKATAAMIQDKPLAGHGFNGFNAYYMNYQAHYFEQNPNSQEAMLADDIQYPYNFLLKTTAEYGVIGLALVLGILFIGLFKPQANAKLNDAALVTAKAGLIGIFVFSLFSYPEEILPIKLVLVICLAAIAGYSQPLFTGSFISKVAKQKAIPILKIAFAALLLLGLGYFYPMVKNLKTSYQQWNNAYWRYTIGDYEGSVPVFETCYPALQSNGEYLLNYGKALSMAGQHTKAIVVLGATKQYLNNSIVYTALGDSYKAIGRYTLAEEAYQHASHMTPGRFYPLYLLAKLYNETGQTQLAKQTAILVLDKEVKINSTAIKEIKEEMNKIIKNER